MEKRVQALGLPPLHHCKVLPSSCPPPLCPPSSPLSPLLTPLPTPALVTPLLSFSVTAKENFRVQLHLFYK